MADTFLQGIVSAAAIQSPEVINDISAFLVTMFVPETPLMTILPRVKADTVTVEWLNSKTRPRSNTLSVAISSTGQTTLSFVDASMYMQGDILQLNDGTNNEFVEVNADPVIGGSPDTVVVLRGKAGTTAQSAFATNNTVVTLVGNSRTGGEINQNGIRNIRVKTSNQCQTFQFPVQVAGSAQSTKAILPAGIASLFASEQIEAMRNMKRDMEYTSYYGLGETLAAGNRPKQKGFKTQIVTNLTTAPTNAGAYAQDDFIRDGIQKCRDGGGDPNMCLVSTGFLRGLAKWGQTPERITVGETAIGTPIEAYKAPFLSRDLVFMEAQQLGKSNNITAFLFNTDEVAWRNKRNEFWNPRGVRGDAIEGDYIAEGCTQLVNEAHHAWIEGITAFA